METKHTPGPWVVRMTASGNPFIYDDATGKNIAGVTGIRPGIDAEESQANAALIAQAPDLLADRDRLRQINAQLVAALETIVCDADKFMAEYSIVVESECITLARAALTAAKGE